MNVPKRKHGTTKAGRRRESLGLLFVAPAMAFVSAFFLLPLAGVVRMSFQDYPLLGEQTWIGLANYAEALGDAELWRSVRITLLYTVIITPLLFFVALSLALLVKGNWGPSRAFRTIFFLPVVIGFGSASYLWYWFTDKNVGALPQILRMLHLGNQDDPWTATMPLALFVVIGLVVWKFSSFQMILLMAAIQGVPQDVLEAAEIDGCTGLRQLRHVTLPLIKRTIALVLVLSVAGSLLAFDQFYIITGGGPDGATITTVFDIYRQSFLQFRLGYGAALSVMAAVALLVVSTVQQRILKSHDED